MDIIRLFIIEDNPPVLKSLFPPSQIKLQTVCEGENVVLKAILAGTSDYQMKGALTEPMLSRKILRYFAKAKMPCAIEQSKTPKNRGSLTIREVECLQIIAKGLSNQETATVLQLSIATIRTHLEHIYQKLDVNNRVEAITEGIRQGIIDL